MQLKHGHFMSLKPQNLLNYPTLKPFGVHLSYNFTPASFHNITSSIMNLLLSLILLLCLRASYSWNTLSGIFCCRSQISTLRTAWALPHLYSLRRLEIQQIFDQIYDYPGIDVNVVTSKPYFAGRYVGAMVCESLGLFSHNPDTPCWRGPTKDR